MYNASSVKSITILITIKQMKKTITTIAMLIAAFSHGQITASISQGQNTLARVELHDYKHNNGYITFGLETEFNDKVKHYGLLAGYTFDNLFVRNLELKTLLGYAGADFNGVYGSLTVAYKLPDTRLRLQIVNQYTNKYSGFIGISYTFGKHERI